LTTFIDHRHPSNKYCLKRNKTAFAIRYAPRSTHYPEATQENQEKLLPGPYLGATTGELQRRRKTKLPIQITRPRSFDLDLRPKPSACRRDSITDRSPKKVLDDTSPARSPLAVKTRGHELRQKDLAAGCRLEKGEASQRFTLLTK